jgi:type I restriction enzyme S subunit
MDLYVFQESQVKARIGWQSLTTREYLKSGKYGLVGGIHLVDGKIDWDSIPYVSKWRYDQDKFIQLQQNDVLISKDGTIGKIAFVDSLPFPSTLNSGVYVIRPKEGKYDPSFMYHLLNSFIFEDFIEKLSAGSTISHLYQKDLKHFFVQIPSSLDAQKAIAEALGDIDELITFLKRELIKKINLRTAFTQRRLKFENAKKVKLGNYANFSKGSGLPKSQLTTNGKFKAIHYGELFLKYPESIRRVISRTDTSSNAIYSRVNDVLMPSSDVTPTGLAVASCIREDDVILGGDVLIIRPNSASELDGRYLSYVIRNSKQEILKLVRGTTVYHIYGKDMADFELFLPGIDEQIEIVESLDLQREEISLLEEELQKYEWLKQGMMNDLLTGKVRLV